MIAKVDPWGYLQLTAEDDKEKAWLRCLTQPSYRLVTFNPEKVYNYLENKGIIILELQRKQPEWKTVGNLLTAVEYGRNIKQEQDEEAQLDKELEETEKAVDAFIEECENDSDS